MPSILAGSILCALSPMSADAPQSTSNIPFAVSRKKHVFNRPPEPKASPEPTIVSRISGCRARTRGNFGVPALEIIKLVRNGELRRFHEINCHQTGDIGNRETIAGDVRLVFELAVD